MWWKIPIALRVALLAAIALAMLASEARADLHILAVAADGDDIVVRRSLGAATWSPVAVDARLEAGDLLECSQQGAQLILGAPGPTPAESTTLTCQAPFLLMVPLGRPGDGGLVVDLLGGSILVESGQPTRVNAGETLTGSERTSYAVRVSRTVEGVAVATSVLDGQVFVLAKGVRTTVSARERIEVRPTQRIQRRELTSQECLRAATIRAETDLRIRGPGEEIVRAEAQQLQQAYYQVYLQKGSPEARMDLVEAQLVNRVAEPTIAYQLQRVPRDMGGNSGIEARRLLAAAAADVEAAPPAQLKLALQILEDDPGAEAQSKLYETKLRPRFELWEAQRRIEELAVPPHDGPRLPMVEIEKFVNPRRGLRVPAAARLGLALNLAENGQRDVAAGLAAAALAEWDPAAAKLNGAALREAWKLAAPVFEDADSGITPAREWVALLQEQGLTRQAVQGYELRIKRKLGDARDVYGLGASRQEQGRSKEAAQLMEKALVLDLKDRTLTGAARQKAFQAVNR